jgi:5-methylcytosine-specific restriction endonuclease McrA
MRTLVLNGSFEPHGIAPARRALELVRSGKAELIEAGPGSFRSVSLAFPVPAVVQLRRFISVPRRHTPLTRKGVLSRDGYLCAYCQAGADTIDHVIPRSRTGGIHHWENVVACCKRCNNFKGNLLLAELGWTLGVTPFVPVSTGNRFLRTGHVDPIWEPYLGATA